MNLPASAVAVVDLVAQHLAEIAPLDAEDALPHEVMAQASRVLANRDGTSV